MMPLLQFQIIPTSPFDSGGAPSAPSPILIALILTALIYGGLTVAIFVLRFFLHKWYRTSIGFRKVLFLVTLPKEPAMKKGEMDKTRTLQELQQDIAAGQLLFSAIGGLHVPSGLKTWFLGREDNFSFEMVMHKGLISFYVAAPPRHAEFLKQQIHALSSNAMVEDIEDYNIFLPQGVIKSGYLRLIRQPFLPLKTFRKIEADPMEGIMNSLSKIKDPDSAAIQYIVRPAKRAWRKHGAHVAVEMQKGKSIGEAIAGLSLWSSLWRSVKSSEKHHNSQKDPNRMLSSGEQEAQKAIQEKVAEAGLEVNIRVVVASSDAERAQTHLRDIMDAYNQYNQYEFGNSLGKFHPNFKRWIVRDFIFRSFKNRWQSILCPSELASMFHFPLPSSETPNIRWLVARKSVPPSNIPTEGTILGKCMYRGIDTQIRIKREDRRRHFYIIGRSGVGKSELMVTMAKQDIANGEGVAIIDPHGDFVESVLAAVPPERMDDVVYFNPSDTDRPVGLNMLEAKSEDQKDFAVQEMIAIFYKLFPPEMIGPMFEHNMRNVMLTLMSDMENPGTIAEIPRMFTDNDFQKVWIAKLKDPVVRAFWEKEMAKTSDFHKSEMLGYLISKVGRFVENEMIRNIIGQPHSGFDFREIMDKKKILLVNLAKGKTGEVNSELLGLIIVSKLQMAALSRADLPEKDRHDFYLYMDEFQNFITDSIATILSEARKYKLALIMAHQYLGQLSSKDNKDTKVRDAVLGNAGTIAVFRIGVEDAEILAKEFTPTFNEFDLINTEKYTAYMKLLIDNTASRPFNMATLPPTQGDVQRAELIKELSRLKYGRDKMIVESEIMERSALGEAGSSAAPLPVERTL